MAETTLVAPTQQTPSAASTLGAARFDRREIAGSLGDLGTFLPLLVGMTLHNGLNFSTALFFAGLFNIVTGVLFAVPMAVQPMKAIAAIAITQGLTVPQIVVAGAIVSLLVLLLGLTGLIDWFTRIVPAPVIRGVQMSVGVALAIKGAQLVYSTGAWLAPDGYLVAVFAVGVAALLMRSRRVPAALVLFAAGILLVGLKSPAVFASLQVGFTLPQLAIPAPADVLHALPAAIPQLPLTTLNSVIAVCALSATLFPGRSVTPRHVAVSVGAMNLIGVWFAAMPMCHGAGGMAGQYAFGARTNGSILFLGAVKMALAVLLGASLLSLAIAFPLSILGVMLAVSGIELARAAADQVGRRAWLVVAITVIVALVSGNVAIGFAIGFASHLALRWRGKEATR